MLVSVFLYGCHGFNPLRNSLTQVPPYKKYVRSLEEAHLDQSAMAKAWIQSGDDALHDSIVVSLPFAESGYFKASEPEARSYRFDAREGQVLTVNGSTLSKTKGGFFLDLFSWKENSWVPLAHGDSTFNLTYEFDKDHQQCLIRIQPELLITAYYTISISVTPVLINPVSGATNKSIGSFYGDSRDGGKRKHEGVDIFAKKGTAVVAPTAGYISRVGNTSLGGKVVWLQDSKRGHAYYFAHLDSQAVKAGMKVTKGDLLGTVGNTGNARFTPSHLHFGIYQSKSVDPVNYIRTLEATVKALPWDTTFTQPDFRVNSKNISLHFGPGEKKKTSTTLVKNTYVRVIAQSGNWYRVLLPNDLQGFVEKQKIVPIEKGKRLRLKQPAVLLAETQATATPLAHLESESSVEVLAHFENFQYVRTKEGLFGWLMINQG